jgi:hypothetical protein
MEDFKISRQRMEVFKDQIHVLFLGLLIGLGHCAIVADEIPCVDDLALNAPEGASVAKILQIYVTSMPPYIFMFIKRGIS